MGQEFHPDLRGIARVLPGGPYTRRTLPVIRALTRLQTLRFSKNVEVVMHEAELVGAMATVLTKEGMSDADDETYSGFAKSMKEAASEIVDAAKSNNYDQARAAAGKIDKACSQCHEAYR